MSFSRIPRLSATINADLINTCVRDTNLDLESFAVAMFIAVNCKKILLIEDIAMKFNIDARAVKNILNKLKERGYFLSVAEIGIIKTKNGMNYPI